MLNPYLSPKPSNVGLIKTGQFFSAEKRLTMKVLKSKQSLIITVTS